MQIRAKKSYKEIIPLIEVADEAYREFDPIEFQHQTIIGNIIYTCPASLHSMSLITFKQWWGLPAVSLWSYPEMGGGLYMRACYIKCPPISKEQEKLYKNSTTPYWDVGCYWRY